MPGKGWLVKGGVGESVLAPMWRDETSLYVISDWPGWWNIYQLSLSSGIAEAIYPAEEEFTGPLWRLGHRPYAVLSDGRLAVLHGCGGMRLGVLDPGDRGAVRSRHSLPGLRDRPVGGWHVHRGRGRRAVHAAIGDPGRRGNREGEEALFGLEPSCLRPASCRGPASCSSMANSARRCTPGSIRQPTRMPWCPEGERPPYVVWAHRGPASHADRLLDLAKAYFTSRGIGIIDVNYGGSTGYGRSYRERLRRQWGVVDVEDVIAAAQALVEAGEADPARLAIRGVSAGAWTALAAVTTHAGKERLFKAATSYSGITDLRDFAAKTHDFESHYADGLAGPLPGFQALYAERSPVGHVTNETPPHPPPPWRRRPHRPAGTSPNHRQPAQFPKDPPRPPNIRGRIPHLQPRRNNNHRSGGRALLLRPDARFQSPRSPTPEIGQLSGPGHPGTTPRSPPVEAGCRTPPSPLRASPPPGSSPREPNRASGGAPG